MTSAQRISVIPSRISTERVADRIVEALVRIGVDSVYGIPGGAISPIYDALLACPRIRVVHVRHETNAVFMAIGHARQRSSLPCVLVTSGPGVTNALTGLAAAHAEGVPLLLLAGEVPKSRTGRFALQDGGPEALDIVHLLRSVTRHAAAVTQPGHAVVQITDAARRARALRGPVFLSLPLDVAVMDTATTTYAVSLPPPRAPNAASLAAATAALRSARRPLVVVGSGARRSADAVRRFVARFHLPTMTSPKAKGIVSETEPHNLGVFGYGGHPSTAQWLARNPPDVVLALGCGLGETSTNGWAPALQASGTMIQVDLDPARFGRNYRVDVGLECDVGVATEALSDGLDDRAPWTLPLGGIDHFEIAESDDPSAGLAPAHVIETLQECLPPETAYTADIGEHLLFAIHYLRITRPDQFLTSMAFGSMGSGIGSAIGLQLVSPKRRVVAICGDYGFQMYGMDLATCVQERIPVTFVVMNDARMRMVEAGLDRIYGRGLAMDGPRIDFAAVARAHGAHADTVTTRDELRAALVPQHDDLPHVLDVRIDPGARFPLNARAQEISNFTAR